jgi:predicted permease
VSVRRLAHRLLALVRFRRLESELDDEIQAHLELAERDLRAAGLSPAEARNEARRRFGGITQMQDAHRDSRGVRWLENLIKDGRYGTASLTRDPLFALVAIGVLALGIGANTAMFSLVDAVFLKPLPFSEPDRIVRVWEAPTPVSINSTTPADFLAMKERSTTFEALSAETLTSATITIAGEPTRLEGRLVSADHFRVFGLQPALGRTFARGDDEPGAAPVVVLSHAVWRDRFGADPRALDRDLLLDGVPHRVVGVLPPGSFDRDIARPGDGPAAFWKPLIFTPRQLGASEHWLNPVGRLRPKVTIEQAQADMLHVRASLAGDMPAWKKDWSFRVEPFDQRLVNDTLRQSIAIASGAVVLVLLIACANIANLLLAKGATRAKELAVRSALGASRGRLVAQLFTESLVLCSLGGLAGVLVATLLMDAAVPLLPASIPFTSDVTLDLRVLAAAAAIALVVSLAIGLLPSLRTAPDSLTGALNAASRGSTHSSERLSRAIVVCEVAVSLVLICGAFLLFRSLHNLQQVDLGVRVDGIVTASIDLPLAAYPDAERAAAFFESLSQRVAALPGVERVGLSQDVPLGGAGGENLRIPGREGQILVGFKRVDAGYFATLDIPVVAGRGFRPDDRAGSPRVIVINQELARQLASRFELANPVGARVTLASPRYDGGTGRVEDEIVGVIQDERISRDLRSPRQPAAYVVLGQIPQRQIKLIVRVADLARMMPGVRETVRQLDPQLALARIETMEQIKRRSLAGAAQPTSLIGAFAVIAALLAALGLYGILSHAVSQRRQELAIRIALGARPSAVLRDVLGRAILVIGAGLAIGSAGAASLSRVLRSMLFEVSPLDPIAFAVAALFMAIVSLAAAWIPAARATKVDAMAAMRSDN